MLRLSLEAARREREVAEQDLEALLQSHRQEMQAWRQHLQQVGREGWAPSPGCWHHPACRGQEGAMGPWVSPQVLQEQRRQAEERTEALEHRHRALLQEVLRDVMELSAHNQRLQEAKSHGSADATTQAP